MITWQAIPRERSPRSANLSMIECTLSSISDLLCARLRIYIVCVQNSSELLEATEGQELTVCLVLRFRRLKVRF